MAVSEMSADTERFDFLELDAEDTVAVTSKCGLWFCERQVRVIEAIK